jgi:predicted secreted protein
MAANYGRKVTLTWNSASILGVREKGLTIGGEAVNVTSDEDNGVQMLLAEDAEVSHSISLSGVTKSDVLRLAKASGSIQGTVVLTYEDGYTISGTFNIGEYSEGLPYNEAITFDTTLMSTGAVTHTPASA